MVCLPTKNGASRARTDDLDAASVALSQLSYSPETGIASLAIGAWDVFAIALIRASKS